MMVSFWHASTTLIFRSTSADWQLGLQFAMEAMKEQAPAVYALIAEIETRFGESSIFDDKGPLVLCHV
jgi:phytoene/squalene synthetase